MPTSLVLLKVPYLNALDQESTLNHHWIRHAMQLLQQLVSLVHTLLDISTIFQIYLRTVSILVSGLAGFGILDCKCVTDNNVVKSQTSVTLRLVGSKWSGTLSNKLWVYSLSQHCMYSFAYSDIISVASDFFTYLFLICLNTHLNV